MEELLKLLGFSTPLIYAAAAYGFFHWLDENASNEAKAALARTMLFKDYKNEQVASALVEVFDRIYTYPLLRWRAFFRSLIFTTVVFAIYLFELHLYRNHPTPGFFGFFADWSFDYRDRELISVLLNVVTDYLSLFVIRPVLVRSGTKPVIGLTLGAVSGAAIVLAVDSLRQLVLIFWSFGIWPAFADILPVLIDMHDVAWGLTIFGWPALAVFTWLPLFALGIVVVRLLTPLSWIVGRTQWFLKEGKEHPLKAIGYVAAVVVFIGTVAARAVFSA
jgi:hypothetical protein